MYKGVIFSAIVAAFATLAFATPVDVPRQATQTTGVSSPPTATITPEQLKAEQEALILTPSEPDRISLLIPNVSDATNITYNFVNNTVLPPTGGTIALATVANFPALIGTEVSMGIGFVNPCGLNTPHNHPRANEFLTVVQGMLVAGLVLEENPNSVGNVNGTDPEGPIHTVSANLTTYQGFLFPKGLTHFQFNPTCEPAVFAAAFDNSDPGRTEIARTFFSELPDDVISSATGNHPDLLDAARIDQLRAVIPAAFAELMTDCAQRCHLPTGS